MSGSWTAEPAAACRAELGEGPLWDAETGTLIWLDIFAKRMHRFDPSTGTDSACELDRVVTAVGLRANGGLVCAFEHGFGFLDEASGTVQPIARPDLTRPGQRMNDGKCDPGGGFIAGSMIDGTDEPASTLYRLSGGELSELLAGVTMSNGLDWSADQRCLYFVDTPTLRVDVFSYDIRTGELSDRRILTEFPPDYGIPDGLTVDSEGFLWIAFWGGGAVRRISPEGDEVGVVHVPTPQPTSCAFGGAGLDQLYITSASWDLGDQADDMAGALFVVSPGVSGRQPNRYGG